jgi:phage terminase large subunit-like protein
MPWKPSYPGELPTLGYDAIDWIAEYLAAPDKAEYEPFVLYREQEDFLLDWYEIDPRTGRFRYSRGLLGRPRGWGKSPLLAAVCCLEALAPIVPGGWDSRGQPVGRPWYTVRTPYIDVAAVSEEQTQNTWQPLLEMLRDGPAIDEYDVEPLETAVILPKGKIVPRTSMARTAKGRRPIFAVLDQTEEWVPSNAGPRLANVMRANAAKVGGRTLESPNAYIPGEESVAESSANYAQAISEGRAKDDSLLYSHREAPGSTDMSDKDSLVDGLRFAYGDSSGHADGCVIHPEEPCPPGHVDLDFLIRTIWDPAQDVQMSRSDFLNQITHASDSWISRPQWQARMDLEKVVSPDEWVVLGFDGSRGRNRGNADATSLVGIRVEDAHVFEIKTWEQPGGQLGKDWLPPLYEIDREVNGAFDRYKVAGFYADPSGYAPYVAQWEAKIGRRLRVKASQNSPIALWPRTKDARVEEYVRRLELAIKNGEMTHDGSSALTRHVLNARKRATKTGYLLYKAYPDSPNKIDGAYAMTIAFKARVDALAKGIGRKRSTRGRVTVLS